MTVFMLSEDLIFPPPYLSDESGLLAVGGDLAPERLLLAYTMGIFPWYSEEDPILWWSPDPRLVLFPQSLKISKSLGKTIKKDKFTVTVNRAFKDVIKECASVRKEKGDDTWIVNEMQKAYLTLHKMGKAHSVETWQDGILVGGLYGVSIGKAFFGESMFSRVTDASKVAFAKFVKYLNENAFEIIDCQVRTDHLVSLGAEEISRSRFLGIIKRAGGKRFEFKKNFTL